MTLHLLAPAKLNLTLEVLGKRPDGYHEIVSVMQTIDLADRIAIHETSDIQVTVTGPEAHGAPDDVEQNLAYRAARVLQKATGVSRGVAIAIEKRVPASAGLGGGSSDAAAILRGLNRLWQIDLDMTALESIAASLGSDVPFFLHCGTALSSGRGEVIERLPDVHLPHLTLFTWHGAVADKTGSMYAALEAGDFSGGELTERTVKAIRFGRTLGSSDLGNAFEAAVRRLAPAAAGAIDLCLEAGLPVVVAGSGPSFFSPTYFGDVHQALVGILEREHGVRASQRRAFSAAEALAVRES